MLKITECPTCGSDKIKKMPKSLRRERIDAPRPARPKARSRLVGT